MREIFVDAIKSKIFSVKRMKSTAKPVSSFLGLNPTLPLLGVEIVRTGTQVGQRGVISVVVRLKSRLTCFPPFQHTDNTTTNCRHLHTLHHSVWQSAGLGFTLRCEYN